MNNDNKEKEDFEIFELFQSNILSRSSKARSNVIADLFSFLNTQSNDYNIFLIPLFMTNEK